MLRSMRTVMAHSAMVLALTTAAEGASLVPLSSFGGGDGWLAPFDRSYLTVDHTQRGLAYNPTTGHLLVVNRAGGLSVNILDGLTGEDVGTLSGVGSLSGGTFAGSMIGIGEDGAIYVANLTTDATVSPFKIYRWENEAAAAPTLAYSGVPLAGARIGDTLDVIGSGASTQLVAGYGSTPAVAGNNSFALFGTSDGVNYNATHVTIASSPPNGGDFRLGITFRDDDTVIGSQTGHRLAHIVDVTGSTGTLYASFATEGAANNPMDFAVVENLPLLATVNTNDSRLFVYDITEPFDMVDPNPNIAVATTTTPPHNANVNATGQVKFGAITGTTAILYALDTNNGIQAFELTLTPPPPSLLGDFNEDGKVDAADYVRWRANETANDPLPNDDGLTTQAERFDLWRANFGNMAMGAGSSARAVPEPSACLLLAVGMSIFALCRRRLT
jgi:hypothetical protein